MSAVRGAQARARDTRPPTWSSRTGSSATRSARRLRVRSLVVLMSILAAGLAAALGLALSSSGSDPLATVADQGRRVPLTTAMESWVKVSYTGRVRAKPKVYLMATLPTGRYYRVVFGRFTCYAITRPGWPDFSEVGCAGALGRYQRVLDNSLYKGTNRILHPVADAVFDLGRACGPFPITQVEGFAIDAAHSIQVLNTIGQPLISVPVKDNIYVLGRDGLRLINSPNQLPRPACSLQAVDSKDRVLWRSDAATGNFADAQTSLPLP